MTTHYDVLGISPDADDETIRVAFRKAAKRFHPDLNAGNRTAERHFRRIMAARDLLSDPEQRARYDKNLGRESQPWLRLWRDARVKIIAGVLAGGTAGGILFVFSSSSSPEPVPQVSSLESMVEIPKTSPSDEMPDAESAEIKAMRDGREVADTGPAPAISGWSALGDNHEELMLSRPSPGALASRPRFPSPLASHWQRNIAKPISKRLNAFWHQLEAKIQSVKFPKT